jgi:4-hydroxybenzoyl-CoA thioesterase
MSNLVHRRQFAIEWGHCDPAGIVFNSRFFEFFDWNTWLLFEVALGVRPGDLYGKYGIMAIPLVDAKGQFYKPAKFNDVVEIASEVSRFGRSSFDVQHRIAIDGELVADGSETRVWAKNDPAEPTRLKAVPIPASVIDSFKVA